MFLCFLSCPADGLGDKVRDQLDLVCVSSIHSTLPQSFSASLPGSSPCVTAQCRTPQAACITIKPHSSEGKRPTFLPAPPSTSSHLHSLSASLVPQCSSTKLKFQTLGFCKKIPVLLYRAHLSFFSLISNLKNIKCEEQDWLRTSGLTQNSKERNCALMWVYNGPELPSFWLDPVLLSRLCIDENMEFPADKRVAG